MIRVLTFHGRLVVWGTNRRAANFSQSNPKSSYSLLTDPNVYANKRKLPSFFSRIFSHYIQTQRITQNKEYQIPIKHFSTSNISISTNTSTNFAWKRLSLICTHSSRNLSPLSKIVFCATSFSVTRCNLVSGIFTLAFSQLVFAGTALAEANRYVPVTKDEILIRAQDLHSIISYSLSSLLEGVLLVFRAVYLAILFLPATTLAPLADRFGSQFRKKWLHLVHQTLERAGPAFIKWGQWAATRPDLFPSDLCLELTKLHSTAPAHDYSYTKSTVEKAFGRKIEELFESFEKVPVASGSIAQVHRARLRGTRADVAVKVRHPCVSESIRRDFAIINAIARLSAVVPGLSWLRLDESVRQFAVFMMSQVDLSREAAHLSRFLYNFRKWRNVSFPRPLYPFVHPSVLVETFEQGESVSSVLDEMEGGSNRIVRKDLAHIGTYAFLKMLLEDNFIHGDMHPGNILVRVPQKGKIRKRKGIFRKKPHIVFLDVGMTAELSRTDRANLHEFLKAVAVRDGRTAAQCTLRLSAHQSCPNPRAFIEELERTFAYWGTPEGDVYHAVECMQQLLETVRRHRVNVDGNVCTVLVTILVLEGWQRKLDPDFDIMNALKSLLLEKESAQPRDCVFS